MDSTTSHRSTSTDARRQAILQAALQSFATKGFTQTTMEDIRQLSGASMGSIYHHFKNKETLAYALYLEGRSDLNAHLQEALNAKSPESGIQMLVRAYLTWFADHPDLGQYILQAAYTEFLGTYFKVLRQKTMTPLPLETLPQDLFAWLQPFIEQGLVRRLPTSLYFPLIVGPAREFVRRWLRRRERSEMEEAMEPLALSAWTVIRAEHS